MNIPPKYEDVVAQLEAALGRESEMIARANQNKLMMDAACGEISTLKEELAEFEMVQQRLTVADQRADALEGLLREWRHGRGLTLKDCASLRDRTDVALKPAAEGEGP